MIDAWACLTALFMPSWAMRWSSFSTSGRSRSLTLVDHDLDAHAEAGLEVLGHDRDPLAQDALDHGLVAQREDRAAQLGDHHGELAAQLHQSLPLRLRRRLGGRVVDEVAEGRQVLGDPVVHLARETLALLGGRGLTDRREDQRGVELEGSGTERLRHRGQGVVEPDVVGVDPRARGGRRGRRPRWRPSARGWPRRCRGAGACRCRRPRRPGSSHSTAGSTPLSPSRRVMRPVRCAGVDQHAAQGDLLAGDRRRRAGRC